VTANNTVIVDFTALRFDPLGYTSGEFVSIGHDTDGDPGHRAKLAGLI
jgi:hypothetical protein